MTAAKGSQATLTLSNGETYVLNEFNVSFNMMASEPIRNFNHDKIEEKTGRRIILDDE